MNVGIMIELMTVHRLTIKNSALDEMPFGKMTVTKRLLTRHLLMK
jgi:hypothetical protein